MTLPALNARLARYGVRVHRVPRRGRLMWVLLQPDYCYWWATWAACARDIQEVTG